MTEPARPPIVLRIKLRYEDVDVLVQRFAPNVGKAGLFLPTKALHPIGTELKFELRLANDTPVIVGLGRVMVVREPDPANPKAVFGMGVELMRVTKESRELILRMLERRRQLGLADVALPSPDEIDAARRMDDTGVRAMPTPARLPADAHGASMFTAPRRPAGALAVAKPVTLPALVPLPPEPMRKRRRLSELLASVKPSVTAGADEQVDVTRARARARALAGADLDAELDALRGDGAAPVEISVEAASAELARQLGGAAVDRKNRALPNPVAVAVAVAVAEPSPAAFWPVAPSPAVTEIDPPGFASELDPAVALERAPTTASELELAAEPPEELGPEPTAPVDAAEVVAMLAGAAAEVVDDGGVVEEAEIGDDDVVEELDEVAEVADEVEVAEVAEVDAAVAAAQDVTGVSTPILLTDPYLDDDEVLGAPTDDPDADPGRSGLLIDDDVDAAMFEGDAAHAELEPEVVEPALLTAPTRALPEVDARLADQLDRALAYAEDHDDEDFGFASPNPSAPIVDEPDEPEVDDDDDFEILAEAAAEDADLALPIDAGEGEEDFVSRLELSRMVGSAPEDPLAGFRDSVMSFGDEQRPYRAPTDPLAGFDDEPAPSYDPGTGSYTYAQRPAAYQAPLDPTAADPDLENALEALDVDLDELGGTGEHLAVPVQPSFNIGSPRRPQAAPAPRADDGVLIQFEDDE